MKRNYLLIIPIILLCLFLESCKHSHEYGNWEVYQEASCLENGILVRYCECGEKETMTTNKTKHSRGEWETIIPASCSEKGVEQILCTVCHEVLSSKEISKTEHLDYEWVVEIEPTCLGYGKRVLKCVDCGEKIQFEKISPPGHSEEVLLTVEATCTQGITQYLRCSVCNQERTLIISKPLGHSFGEWIVDTPVTCTNDGLIHRDCLRCDEGVETQTVISTGHSYNTNIIKKTCTNSTSSVTYSCINCDDVYTPEIFDIAVDVEFGGTTFLMTDGEGYGSYTKYYKINVSGGYGNLKTTVVLYKEGSDRYSDVETYDNTSIKHYIGYRGYDNETDKFELKIIVRDEVGNATEFMVSLKDFSITNEIVYDGECCESTLQSDTTYINLHGFGIYKCNSCNKTIYKDKNGKTLEEAKLKISSDGSTIMSCSNRSTAEILVIPESVRYFADSSEFVYAQNLKYVLFPSNYIYVNLQGTQIEHIYIPFNIGVSLYSCENLKTVIWEDGSTTITSYGTSASYLGRQLSYSNVEEIVIPTSITKINSSVFNMTEKLTTVFYMGTEEEWNNIKINLEGNIYLTEATRYYYSESEPISTGNYWHYVDGVPTIWLQ